jgi:1-deoxy-D-xylulose-5-phosphate synthase
MVVMTPSDENECRKMLSTAFTLDGPSAVRYPRGSGPGATVEPGLGTLPVGKGEVAPPGQARRAAGLRRHAGAGAQGGRSAGCHGGQHALRQAAGCRTDRQLANSHDLLVSVEENALIGGAGAEVARALESAGLRTPLLRLGLPDHFIDHGDTALLLAEAGLDDAGIVRKRDRAAGPAPLIVE